MSDMDKEKTVYILGAGASKAVGLPLQAELLRRIFSLRSLQIDDASTFMDLAIDADQEAIRAYYNKFEEERQKLADFIIEKFASHSQKMECQALLAGIKDPNPASSVSIGTLWDRVYTIASDIHVTLEDLFTLFDKVTLGREYFHSYSPQKIDEVHIALRKCIIFSLAYDDAAKANSKEPYRIFAHKLIQTRLNVSSESDPLSIITMNWDSALEKEIFRQCQQYNTTSKEKVGIYPDLCFYDYCFKQSENRIVSTHIKAQGHRNIKLLKLHGAMNWLACPYCGRVYVDYDKNIALNELFDNCVCPCCLSIFGTEETTPQMRSILITPTFLKDLNDLHIKNIWHNALLDLIEATKLVFIGYSFPDADFEMRCLLKKAIRPQTPIEVVLSPSNDPQAYENELKKFSVPKQKIDSLITKFSLPEFRYASFFGRDSVKFFYDGMEAFVKSL
jgi:NAD-dependent SIR2 family protein deacetylase